LLVFLEVSFTRSKIGPRTSTRRRMGRALKETPRLRKDMDTLGKRLQKTENRV